MKQFTLNLIVLLVVTIFLISCSDDNPVEPNDITGGGSITINGGGFSNQTFDLKSGVAAYETKFQSTMCSLIGEAEGDSVAVTLSIYGDSRGVYNWRDWGGGYFTGSFIMISADNQSNFYLSELESGRTIVTHYGAVAQNIKGTFSGKLNALYDLDSITVEGSFNCFRLEDDSVGDF